jgi:hypothetical protein
VEALLIPPENARALMIAEPELGERIMRALILRRIVAIETGAGGPVLIGSEFSPDVIRLQSFLARNAYPHQLLDLEKDEDARKLVERYAPNSAGRWQFVRRARSSKNPRPNWHARSEWCRSTNGIKPMKSRLSAPDPPVSRPRSMPPPKVSRSSSSTRAPSADRQGRARESKIISAFMPAFLAGRSPGGLTSRRRNLVRG